jgi:hypothetical protein
VRVVTSDQRNRVLAVNLAGGSSYWALVEAPDLLVTGEVERIDLAEGLDPAEQLADFAARVRQELSRLEPVAVGVINTRKYASWKYADAWRRVTMEAAVMLSAEAVSTNSTPIHYQLVKQETMAKKTSIPLAKLQEVCVERWGDAVPRYRKERFPAVVGAMFLAQEFLS